MPKRENQVRNADFKRGKTSPAAWEWFGPRGGVRWERENGASEPGVTIVASRRSSTAGWRQVLPCKPGEFYRVDADVRCRLDAADERSGFVMSMAALSEPRRAADRLETPAVHRATRTCTVRAVFEAPSDARRMCIAVEIVNAKGWATIEAVRVLNMLEPEEDSHLLAIPPPPTAVPAPRTAKSVVVCSSTADSRALTTILRAALGSSNVVTGNTEEPPPFQATRREVTRGARHRNDPAVGGRDAVRRCDAILLPDPTPPSWLRGWKGLLQLAEQRLVIVSLPAFATLTANRFVVRRVEQPDDPICAKVAFANHVTRGFALADVFPFAWSGDVRGSFVQNHFRKSPALDRFLARNGFTTLLTSMACQEVTTGRPVCLFKETSGGGLYVVDLDPVEAEPSTASESNVAVYWLLSMLGHSQNALGQFAMPVRGERRLRELIREAGARFSEFVVHDGDVPIEQVEHQIVTIGREDQTYGLPFKPKPLILVRSGLRGGDVESVCGALLWFKQLLRMPPHACPYAEVIASRFRFAWVPLVAAWERRDGWRRTGAPPAVPMALDVDGAELACVIDVVSVPRNDVRVVVAGSADEFEHVENWLPALQSAFPPGDCLTWAPDIGAPFTDRDRFEWRRLRFEPKAVREEKLLSDTFLRDARGAGASTYRIEVPGCDADFVAHSIQRTDLVATLLEHFIGLQFGLAACNRSPVGTRLDGFPPVAPGDALIVPCDQLRGIADARVG